MADPPLAHSPPAGHPSGWHGLVHKTAEARSTLQYRGAYETHPEFSLALPTSPRASLDQTAASNGPNEPTRTLAVMAARGWYGVRDWGAILASVRPWGAKERPHGAFGVPRLLDSRRWWV